MTVEPFRAAHVVEMLGRADPYAERFEAQSEAAVTVRVDGKPVLCGGVVELAPHKGLLWSFVTPEAKRYGKSLHAAATRFISTLPYVRLEATCRTGWQRGGAWLRRMGFEYEGTMRAWGPDRTDFDLYARVR